MKYLPFEDFEIHTTMTSDEVFHKLRAAVSGKIHSEGSGCCVRIRMRLLWFSFLFYLLILGWLWYMYFGGIANLIVQKVQTGIWQIESPWLLLPGIGMFAFGYLLSVGTFRSETRHIRIICCGCRGRRGKISHTGIRFWE